MPLGPGAVIHSEGGNQYENATGILRTGWSPVSSITVVMYFLADGGAGSDGGSAIRLHYNNSALPANTVVKIYEAVV